MSDIEECVEIKEEPEDFEILDDNDDLVEVKVEAFDPPCHHGKNGFPGNLLESLIDVKDEYLIGPDNPLNQIAVNIQKSNIGHSLGKRRSKPIQKTCSCCSSFENKNKQPHHNSKIVKAIKRRRQLPPPELAENHNYNNKRFGIF